MLTFKYIFTSENTISKASIELALNIGKYILNQVPGQ